MATTYRSAIAAALFTSLVACGAAPTPRATATAPSPAPRWGHTGERGPAHWAELSGAFAACAIGRQQSPLALESAQTTDRVAPAPTLAYRAEGGTLVDSGHAYEVDLPAGSTLTLDGQSYALAQFHFHSPSEHTLDGESFPLEMHLVHRDAAGHPALVLAVLFREGEPSALLASLGAQVPDAPGHDLHVAPFDLADALPSLDDSYRYDGSLTTPPCTEGVRWIVLRAPASLSHAQLETIRGARSPNARPTQPLGERAVVHAHAAH